MNGSYNVIYLNDAMRNLGEMTDYAVNDLGIDANEFMKLFVSTGIAGEIERANPKYIAGMSGIELAQTVLDRSGCDSSYAYNFMSDDLVHSGLSNVYWMGWVLAYYQWHSGMSFGEILEYVSCDEMLEMYKSLHEASEDVFVNRMNERVRLRNASTRLQRRRRECGYSQRGLADRSNVSIRAIQEYESRARNINRASGETLLSLAGTLGCRIEDIMEYNITDAV